MDRQKTAERRQNEYYFKTTDKIPCEHPINYVYEEGPSLTKDDYKCRTKKLFSMPQASDYDYIVIYGDREHFSNIQYFTGYDPRWEETLLLLHREKKPLLLWRMKASVM